MPVRRHQPTFIPRASYYNSSARHDYGIDDSINRVEYFSNAVLEDTYDAANKSRGRDYELLRNANAAIVSTEQHSSPRSSAVSRRVRASTAPPAPRSAPAQQAQQVQYSSFTKVAEEVPPSSSSSSSHKRPVLIYLRPPTPNRSGSSINVNPSASKPVVRSVGEVPWLVRARAGSVPPMEIGASSTLPPRPKKKKAVQKSGPPPALGTSQLRAHRPPINSDVLRQARARSLEAPRRARYFHEDLEGSYEEPASRSQVSTNELWAHRPMMLRKDAARLAKARAREGGQAPSRLRRAVSEPRNVDRASDYYFKIPDVKEKALTRYLYAHRGRFGGDTAPKRASLGDFPQVYVPWKGQGPSNRAKAAIIGSRLEAEDGGKKVKRPRSQFAANKLREFKIQDIEEGVYYRPPNVTGALHASRPPLPKPTDRKAIRDVDGFTKPRNVMSWQYRVESRLSPDDIIYQPSSYIRLREQVRDVQDKMDRQRQLLDRYLDTDNMSASTLRKDAISEA